jgi:hypothetical protein
MGPIKGERAFAFNFAFVKATTTMYSWLARTYERMRHCVGILGRQAGLRFQVKLDW